MYLLTDRNGVVKVIVIQLSPEAQPSVIHDTDVVDIIVIVPFVVRLEQDVSRLWLTLQGDVKLKGIACRQLIDRRCHIAFSTCEVQASSCDLCVDRSLQIPSAAGRVCGVVKLIGQVPAFRIRLCFVIWVAVGRITQLSGNRPHIRVSQIRALSPVLTRHSGNSICKTVINIDL